MQESIQVPDKLGFTEIDVHLQQLRLQDAGTFHAAPQHLGTNIAEVNAAVAELKSPTRTCRCSPSRSGSEVRVAELVSEAVAVGAVRRQSRH